MSYCQKLVILLLRTVNGFVKKMKTRDLSESDFSGSVFFHNSASGLRFLLALSLAVLALTPVVATQTPVAAAPAAPKTARDFFNAGAKQLREGKLREAEAFF